MRGVHVKNPLPSSSAPCSPVQTLQLRSKRCARCWLVVSLSIQLIESRGGAVLLSGSTRTDSCSCKGKRREHS